MLHLIDTHAHLSTFDYLSDISFPTVSVSVDLNSSFQQILFQRKSRFVIPAVGVHPWFCQSVSFHDLLSLFAFTKSNNIKILGEIGLDFSVKHKASSVQQLEIFTHQLNFASLNGLSVSLHSVKANIEVLSLLNEMPVKGVLHGFSGSPEQAWPFIEKGFKIGVNGMVLRNNTPRYLHLVKMLPLSSIVLETDFPNVIYSPGLKPSLNMIILIAKKVAQIKSSSLENVVKITSHNAIESLQLDVIE
ncbi:TatD family hydrolase [Thiomicrospira sp. R3]|uniref:TatD family hydrolase n=1 Tax=Thiomicrospira sp. R3 TaxID=3035472 RepID=UPI00259BE5BF|nr:TatD family hydrolase [Thiomicrospira sp. R3]WFE69255.1 TatD family hydrolase [Thiomicrospira sp. R3]